MTGTLYIVGTPIGNLKDFSERARETLASVDFIAAEDTRVTLRLLNYFGIKKPLESYFEHNKIKKGEEIIGRLLAGESCALVTDAGMPAISDPGENLVALCHENSVKIETIPGPCAAVTALAASGLPSARFCFEGFLSVNRKQRLEHLSMLRTEQRTMIFYEAPHKLRRTLDDLLAAFGNRRIAIVRELTKIHEEARRTTLEDAVRYYQENDPKGEFVLVLEGLGAGIKQSPPLEESSGVSAMAEAEKLAENYMADGITRAQAVKKAAKETHVRRDELYRQTLRNP